MCLLICVASGHRLHRPVMLPKMIWLGDLSDIPLMLILVVLVGLDVELVRHILDRISVHDWLMGVSLLGLTTMVLRTLVVTRVSTGTAE